MVLVWPNWFGLDHNDLVTTKWNGHDQNELFRSKLWFSTKMNHNLDLTNSFWSRPNHFGQVQINLVRPEPFWTDQNCFGHIEGQGISFMYLVSVYPTNRIKKIQCKHYLRPSDQLLLWLNYAYDSGHRLKWQKCINIHQTYESKKKTHLM